MTKNTPKPRIVIELDPEHMHALDRARRNVGLNRASFARATIVRHVLETEALTTSIVEAMMVERRRTRLTAATQRPVEGDGAGEPSPSLGGVEGPERRGERAHARETADNAASSASVVSPVTTTATIPVEAPEKPARPRGRPKATEAA